jgi:4'-phosphopantetheinyl transferase
MTAAADIAGLQVVSIVHDQSQTRSGARERIRLALRDMVAATLNLGAERVAVASAPGTVPRLLVDGQPSTAGISFGHDGWISIAAYYAHGTVGVDVMQVRATADWHDVARDYLGPEALTKLVRTPDAQRAHAFAQAWTAHEAHLKCLGLALSEWTALPAVDQIAETAVPAGYVGTVALLNR